MVSEAENTNFDGDQESAGLGKWDIPSSWMWSRQDSIATINPKLKNSIPDELPVTFLPMANVSERSGLIDKQLCRTYGEVKKGFTSFIDGDLIFAKITPCMENGKVAIVDGLTNAIGFGSTEFHVSRPSQAINRKYLFFFLVQDRLRRNARRNMTGSAGQLRVPTAYFKSIEIPVPPISEQGRIVEKIDELFSDLDKSVESLKTAQKQLKVYRQSLLKCAFEGKLTELWRKQNNCKNNEFEKIDATDLPELPQSWSYVRAEHLCHFITKGTTPKKGELYPAKGDVPFIKVYNLTFDGQLDFSIDPTFVSNETHKGFLARSVVYPRDVLMNIVGPPLGKVSLVPESFPEWNINQAIARFRPKEQLLPKYLMYFLLSAVTVDRTSKKAKATAGQFNLTLEICRDIEVPLCHPNEQAEVVRILDSQFSIADQLGNEIESALTNGDALRQSILKQAFSGKLVPQDLNDEPASILLERLNAELQNTNGNGAHHKVSRGKKRK